MNDHSHLCKTATFQSSAGGPWFYGTVSEQDWEVKWTGFGGKAHTREDVGKMMLELGWWLGQWVDGKFPDTQRAGVALILLQFQTSRLGAEAPSFGRKAVQRN